MADGSRDDYFHMPMDADGASDPNVIPAQNVSVGDVSADGGTEVHEIPADRIRIETPHGGARPARGVPTAQKIKGPLKWRAARNAVEKAPEVAGNAARTVAQKAPEVAGNAARAVARKAPEVAGKTVVATVKAAPKVAGAAAKAAKAGVGFVVNRRKGR